jgi:hypothetical protein
MPTYQLYGKLITQEMIDKAIRNINNEIERLSLGKQQYEVISPPIRGKQVWSLAEIKKEMLKKTKFGLEQVLIWSRDV